ncbi:MAG: molybdopterin converting factor [Gammaproteobacteria bacterium]|nr:molybdopterin converting factor [Gammaproteobacteria bacterium]
MKIELRDKPFNPYAELTAYQAAMDCCGKYGATASFVGSMRDFNEGDRIEGLILEFYPGMTEKHLSAICQQAQQRWSLLETLVIHRVGQIDIGEPIVLVAVWSGHRGSIGLARLI